MKKGIDVSRNDRLSVQIPVNGNVNLWNAAYIYIGP